MFFDKNVLWSRNSEHYRIIKCHLRKGCDIIAIQMQIYEDEFTNHTSDEKNNWYLQNFVNYWFSFKFKNSICKNEYLQLKTYTDD